MVDATIQKFQKLIPDEADVEERKNETQEEEKEQKVVKEEQTDDAVLVSTVETVRQSTQNPPESEQTEKVDTEPNIV